MKKVIKKLIQKVKNIKKDPLKEDQLIESLIDRLVEDTNNVFKFSDEEINIIEECIHPNAKKTKVQLPLFSEAKISCFFKIITDNKNNYIIEPEPLFKEKFKEVKKNSQLLSIQEISPSKINRFKQKTSKNELQLVGKGKANKYGFGLLDKFITSRLPKTKVKLKIKNKNKISYIFLELGSFKDKLKTLKFNMRKLRWSKKQINYYLKKWVEEFFYSGQISVAEETTIRQSLNLSYKRKSLIERFLDINAEYSVVEWGNHLINRLRKLIKPRYFKNFREDFPIFQSSYIDIFYNMPSSKKFKDVSSLKVSSYDEDEDFVGGYKPLIGDQIIAINKTDVTKKKIRGKSIKSQDDLLAFLNKTAPGTNLDITFKKKDGAKAISVIRTKNFDEFCKKLIRVWGKSLDNYSKAELAVKDYRKSYLIGSPDFALENITKYHSISLEDTARYKYVDENSYESETSGYSFTKDISFSLQKKKIANKMSFLLSFNEWPNIDNELDENSNLLLNVFIYDITDLNIEKIGELNYDYLDTTDFIKKDCHIIKTNNPSWSVGNKNITQSKKIYNQYDLPEELAFPFNEIVFAKGGKRKLNFRVFLTTKNVKFHEDSGRPIIEENEIYRPDNFEVMKEYSGETEFDNGDGDWREIKIYGSNSIEAEYKLPGYLETNRKEMAYFKSIIAANLIKIRDKDPKKIFEILRDEIDYDDDGYEYEKRHIYKTLDLKRVYEDLMNDNSGTKIDFKSIRNKTLIDERYNILNTLLNLSTRNKKFFSEEDVFLNDVAKKLEIDFDKFTEIKKQKTINAELINFNTSNEEDIFGIKETMTKDQKIKILRNEYSRWNALTNHADKTKRDKAKNMRDLAAKLRSKIN